jgi:1,4-dihydroxy-2-naphthoate octaprenyltransferase
MEYRRLKPIDIVRIAAPHTWSASVMPALAGIVLAIRVAHLSGWSIVAMIFCLVAAILMQSAVNALNDYRDFVSGTDTKENSDDPTDAVLVYNNIAPKSVRNLGICFLLTAGYSGIIAIAISAWTSGANIFIWAIVPLIIGILGALVIGLYSFGPKPISYLPFGEFSSGVVMGFGIIAGVYSTLTGSLPAWVFLMGLPFVLGIGLIMMTNNVCDIERDTATDRRTWPVLLGRERARTAYRIIVRVWYISIPFLTALFTAALMDGGIGSAVRNYAGLIISDVLLLACLPVLVRLLHLPLTPDTRAHAMKTITLANVALGIAYIVGL